MKIKLTLYASVIIEAVKAETFLKGQFDKSVKEGASPMAFNEIAGDEDVHERKITRSIHTSLATLKAEIASYLGGVASSGENVYTVIDSTNTDKIYLYATVSNRFNQSMTEPLAKLCSKYIEDNCVALWYGSLGLFDQAKYYEALAISDMLEVKSGFTKTAPISVTIPYTSTLTLAGDEIQMSKGDTDTITYSIDEGAIDDIEIIATNNNAKIVRGVDCFEVTALRTGICHCVAFSRHDEVNVSKPFRIIITEN